MSVVDAVGSVGEALTGSSPWHAKENLTGDVIPALGDTGNAFENVAESARGVGVQMASPVTGKAGGGAAVGVAAMAAMRVPPPHPPAAATPAATPSEIKVTIPVVVQLDGVTLGRTVVEQIIELNERNMNPPGYPMRGVEPAFG